MLAICEDCAKKYNIDESRIKGKKARFSCFECGHIIVVEKPKIVKPPPKAETVTEEPETESMSDEEAMAYIATMDAAEELQNNSGTATSKHKEGSTGTALTLTLLVGILAACGVAAYIYFQK